ncbi:hypothetical protein [Luteolibacter sp. LG18]|uniref:hypothetical protein n=1 Tax=Luteolibacter sp. LG18 TaxID=2819286 RepID=UPI002B2EC548|nr:hypothetical protein llg_37150 [Luteolibacter sp. LG18]
MVPKTTIANAGNALVPAYLVLVAKGYSVRCSLEEEDGGEIWHAENDALKLSAEDPVALLGLVTMAEARGADWQASDEQIDSFLRTFGLDSPQD